MVRRHVGGRTGWPLEDHEMHMREVKSELRVLANKIEEQNETPAQLRARV